MKNSKIRRRHQIRRGQSIEFQAFRDLGHIDRRRPKSASADEADPSLVTTFRAFDVSV